MTRFLLAAVVLAGAVAGTARADIIIDKKPDVGPFYNPLDGDPNGTYVYANSFVFDGTTGTQLGTVGAYMLNSTGGGSPGTRFRFEVYADNGNAPDPTNVLGTTGYQQFAGTTLTLVTDAVQSPFALTTGTRYWVALSTVGQTSDGAYQVGGHTQNSIYNDNGTFQFSNDPNGQSFVSPISPSGSPPPEMAIYAAGVTAVPEPTTVAMMAAGVLSAGRLVRSYRRRAAG